MIILKFRSSVFVALVVILSMFRAGGAFAQSGQADVQGIVSDPTGAVVVGAQVTLTNTESGDKRVVKTASDGRYTFPTIAPGKYSIHVEMTSFAPETVTGLTIQLDNHVNQDIKLKLGGASDALEVTSIVPAVDTTSNDVGGLVNQVQIDELPIQNRQYLGLALLTPGTTQAGSRSFYSNVQDGGGVYFYANGFSWDGVSNQQTEEGDPRQNIPEDAVGEFKTFTAQMPADLGWAMGGYTALVTKSGTNHIHGDAFEFLRTTGMTALNQFQASTAATTGVTPTYNRSQFGGSIGGPILKNKMHYFGAYERTQATTSWTLFEPTAALVADYSKLLGTTQNPSHDQLIVGRWDGDLTKAQQAFFRVAFEEQLSTANGCSGTTTWECYDGQFPRKAYVAGHTWEPTPRMVNEARFQYAYISYELGPWNTPPPKKPSDFLNPSYAANITVGYVFADFSYGHNYAADGVESRWQVNDTLSIQKGAHSIKIGADVSYVPYTDAVASNLAGTFYFHTDQPYDATPATTGALCPTPTSASCPYQFTQNATPLLYYLPSTQQAYFVEDSWKARHNLTINYGLRYDLQRGSAFLNTYTPNTTLYPVIPGEGNPHNRGDWHNFGPRVGFAYDPTGRSKDVIRGGFGIYYNFIETELSEGEKLNFVACNLTVNPTSGASFVGYPNPYNGQSVGNYCGNTSSQNPPGTLTTINKSNVNVVTLAPQLQNPYMLQSTAGYTRQLGTNLSVAVDGIYSRGLRDYKVYDLNLPLNYPACEPTCPRADTQMAQIQQHASTGASEYKGLFIKFDKRQSHKYMYTVAYTLSSAADNNPHSAPVNYSTPQNDWGPASIDQRNAFVASAGYEIPFIKVLVGGIFQYRSRSPFSVTTTTISPASFPTYPYNPNFNGTAQYVPGTTRDQGNRNISWAAINAYRTDLDTNVATYKTACASNAPGTGSCLSTNLGTGSVATNRYKDFDLRVSRVIPIHENLKVEIIGQAFDLFGTENYTAIGYSPITNTFGIPTNANTVQIGEVAAKFTF